MHLELSHFLTLSSIQHITISNILLSFHCGLQVAEIKSHIISTSTIFPSTSLYCQISTLISEGDTVSSCKALYASYSYCPLSPPVLFRFFFSSECDNTSTSTPPDVILISPPTLKLCSRLSRDELASLN